MSPQLKDINCPWTAFLNRRVCNCRAKQFLHKTVTKTPWTLGPHNSLSPSRSCHGSQDLVCAVPSAGLWGCAGTWWPCLAYPRQVHFAMLRDSSGASMELSIIFLCQTFVSNFIPKEVVYFPFGSVCDSSK